MAVLGKFSSAVASAVAGCQSKEAAATVREPLPWRYVAVLCMCDATHYYSVCSLFSYAGVMSSDLGWAVDRDRAGYVAGFLQSANTFGRCLTSSLWGLVATRCGYKRVVQSTLVSLVLGGLAFAFSTRFAFALAARFIFLGMLNGWVAVFVPLAADVAGDARQTDVTGMVMAAGGVTQLLGPAAGGWLYGAVHRFPAAVPSLLGSAAALVGVCLATAWMPADAGAQVQRGGAVAAADEARALPVKKPSKPLDEEELDARPRSLYWPLPLILLMRWLHGFSVFATFEVVPLWAISTTSLGGLGVTEGDVGNMLSIGALWNIVYFSYIMPWATRRFGLRRFARVISLVAGACCAAMPFAPNIAVATVLQMFACSMSISEGAMAWSMTNNCVPQDRRATINGLAVTIESIAKALGPVGSSWAFAFTLSRWGRAGHSVVFLCLAAAHLTYCGIALTLPGRVENKAETPKASTGKVAHLAQPEVVGLAEDDCGSGGAHTGPATDAETKPCKGGGAADGAQAQDAAEAAAGGEVEPAPGKAGDKARLLQRG